MNSPSATESDTSDNARTSRFSRSSQYRLERWSICSLIIVEFQLPQRHFRFPVLLPFDWGAVQFLEEAFLDESIHGAVVDNHFGIEVPHLSRLLGGRLFDDRFHRAGQHVGYSLKQVASQVA